MRRPSPWLILVVILLGALIVREPRLQQVEDVFLSWFLENSEVVLPPAQVTLVEIGRRDFQRMTPAEEAKPLPKGEAAHRSLSPLEYALFLQAVLEFQPTVVAIEPIVIWPERDKDQEQVFIDQAMRVPKLLIGIELGGKGKRDLAADDVASFPNVTGKRGELAEFTGVWRQPADVKVELGSQIILPNGWKIPIQRDGTVTINPVAGQSVRRLTLNELLLAAQEHEKQRPPSINVDNLKDQIVVLRIAEDPLQPPNIFSATIATIQSNAYVQPTRWAVAWIIVLAAALLSCFLWMISKTNLVLGAIVFCAGYGLLNLSAIARDHVWLPTFLPCALLSFLVLVRLAGRPPAVPHEIAPTG